MNDVQERKSVNDIWCKHEWCNHILYSHDDIIVNTLLLTENIIMKHYKLTTRYVFENREQLRDEYNSMKQSDFVAKYNVSATHLFHIFGPKPIQEIPGPDKEKIFEMRKTMSDRKICTALDIPAHIFYKYIPRRFWKSHTSQWKKKIIQAIQNPKLITHETIEHKPYWDVSTEVPTIGPIKWIKYTH